MSADSQVLQRFSYLINMLQSGKERGVEALKRELVCLFPHIKKMAEGGSGQAKYYQAMVYPHDSAHHVSLLTEASKGGSLDAAYELMKQHGSALDEPQLTSCIRMLLNGDDCFFQDEAKDYLSKYPSIQMKMASNLVYKQATSMLFFRQSIKAEHELNVESNSDFVAKNSR